jgi:hypothetical protein
MTFKEKKQVCSAVGCGLMITSLFVEPWLSMWVCGVIVCFIVPLFFKGE